MKSWPGPVARLFLGELTLTDFRAAAVQAAAERKNATPWEVCDASFYGAEFALLNGQKAEALRFYRQALKDCPRNFTEWTAAQVALRSLGVRP
jgi:lipoprotein NlpI